MPLKFLDCTAKYVVSRLVVVHSCNVFLGGHFLWIINITTDLNPDPKNADTVLCLWMTLNNL